MARTIIIDTEVVGTKRGARIETNPIFTKRRYDVHDGKLNYLYSETRTHATVFHDRVPVDLVLVHLDEKRNVAFDVRSLPPGVGDPVKLLEHRIGGATVHDLYDPRFSIVVDEGDFPFAAPTVTAPLLVAIATVLGLVWYGFDATMAAGYAVGVGAALHVVSLAHHHYVDKGLRILRWKARRRLERAKG
jgi:hypothetical protein